jgi:hypothetical protein
MPIEIHIKVRPLNEGPTGPDEPEDGTFEEPHPKVRVRKDKHVKWSAVGIVKTFKVKFQGSSPFTDEDGDPILEITDERAREATVAGNHHYSVIATDGIHIWEIANCPELDVG